MTDLDLLFSSIGWNPARREGDITHYISESAANGFQPMVKIEDGDYDLIDIVALITYTSYLKGFEHGVKGAAKEFKSCMSEAGLH